MGEYVQNQCSGSSRNVTCKVCTDQCAPGYFFSEACTGRSTKQVSSHPPLPPTPLDADDHLTKMQNKYRISHALSVRAAQLANTSTIAALVETSWDRTRANAISVKQVAVLASSQLDHAMGPLLQTLLHVRHVQASVQKACTWSRHVMVHLHMFHASLAAGARLEATCQVCVSSLPITHVVGMHYWWMKLATGGSCASGSGSNMSDIQCTPCKSCSKGQKLLNACDSSPFQVMPFTSKCARDRMGVQFVPWTPRH
jgi:hypothetical protein